MNDINYKTVEEKVEEVEERSIEEENLVLDTEIELAILDILDKVNKDFVEDVCPMGKLQKTPIKSVAISSEITRIQHINPEYFCDDSKDSLKDNSKSEKKISKTETSSLQTGDVSVEIGKIQPKTTYEISASLQVKRKTSEATEGLNEHDELKSSVSTTTTKDVVPLGKSDDEMTNSGSLEKDANEEKLRSLGAENVSEAVASLSKIEDDPLNNSDSFIRETTSTEFLQTEPNTTEANKSYSKNLKEYDELKRSSSQLEVEISRSEDVAFSKKNDEIENSGSPERGLTTNSEESINQEKLKSQEAENISEAVTTSKSEDDLHIHFDSFVRKPSSAEAPQAESNTLETDTSSRKEDNTPEISVFLEREQETPVDAEYLNEQNKLIDNSCSSGIDENRSEDVPGSVEHLQTETNASSLQERDNSSEISCPLELQQKISAATNNDHSSQLEVEKVGSKKICQQLQMTKNTSEDAVSSSKDQDKVLEKSTSAETGQNLLESKNLSKKDKVPGKLDPSPKKPEQNIGLSSGENLPHKDSPQMIRIKIEPELEVQTISKTQAKRQRRREAKILMKKQQDIEKARRLFQTLLTPAKKKKKKKNLSTKPNSSSLPSASATGIESLNSSETSSRFRRCQDNQLGNQGYPTNQVTLSSGISSRLGKRKDNSQDLLSDNQGKQKIPSNQFEFRFMNPQNSSISYSKSQKRRMKSKGIWLAVQGDHSQYQSSNQGNLSSIHENESQNQAEQSGYEEYSSNLGNLSSAPSRLRSEIVCSNPLNPVSYTKSQKRRMRSKGKLPAVQEDHSQNKGAQSGYQEHSSNLVDLASVPSTSRTEIVCSNPTSSSRTSSRSRKRKRKSKGSSEFQDNFQYQSLNQGNLSSIQEDQFQYQGEQSAYQEYPSNLVNLSSVPSTSRSEIVCSNPTSSSRTSSRSRKRRRKSKGSSEFQDNYQYQSLNQGNLSSIQENQCQYQGEQSGYQEYPSNLVNLSSVPSTSRSEIVCLNPTNLSEISSRSRERNTEGLYSEFQDQFQYESSNQGNLPRIHEERLQYQGEQLEYQEYPTNLVNLSSLPSTSRIGIETMDPPNFFRHEERERSSNESDHLIRVIIADGFREMEFTEEKFDKIRTAISYEIDKIEDGPIPRFHGTHLKSGKIFIESADEWSRDWLTHVVPRLYPWIGARLRIIELDNLEKFHRAILWVPGQSEHIEQVLRRIEKQNPTLNTRIWRVHSGEETLTPRGYNLVLGIPDSSMRALQEMNFMPFLGISRVEIIVTGQEDEGQSRDSFSDYVTEGHRF